METLKLRLFSEFVKNIPDIPKDIKSYMSSNNEVIGKNFKLEKKELSQGTDDGMSYYDRMLVLFQKRIVYDTGYLLWRPGHAFSTNRYDLCINDLKLIEESEYFVIFAYKDGEDKIYLKKCDKKGNIKELTRFDLKAYNTILENQKKPQDSKSFKDWSYRHLPNIGGDIWHCDIEFENDNHCVVIGRHCNRSVDASHDAFMIFIWKKGQGVAISPLYRTHARVPHRKFSSNYLLGSVKIMEDGTISYNARSQFHDVSIDKKFVIQ